MNKKLRNKILDDVIKPGFKGEENANDRYII